MDSARNDYLHQAPLSEEETVTTASSYLVIYSVASLLGFPYFETHMLFNTTIIM